MRKLLLTLTALLLATGIGWAQTFTEIISLDDLETGEYLIFGGNTKNMMSTEMGNNFILYDELSGEMGEEITAGYESQNIFTITVDGDDITIYHEDAGYVSWGKNGATGNQANFYDDEPEDNETWIASIYSNGLWNLENVGSTDRILQYNSGSPRFAAYTSNQQRLRLFKKTSEQATPTLVANPSSLIDFTYMETEGPSDSQSFEISIANVDGDADVSFSTSSNNWEFSVDGDTWYTDYTIVDYDGEKKNIDVRLKAGLSEGNYNDEATIYSDGFDDISVSLNGHVVDDFKIPYSNEFRNTAEYATAGIQGFIFSNVEMVTSAGGYVKLLDGGYIETPTIDFTQFHTLSVSFSATTFGGGTDRRLKVLVSTDDGENYDEVSEYEITGSYENNTELITLTGALNVNTGKLKFEAVNDATRFRDFEIKAYYPMEITGNQGWRMLSSPTNNSYSDFLSGIWTQGFNGAKTTYGEPNVLHFDTYTNELTTLNSFNAAMPAGKGIFTYVYEADEPIVDEETGEVSPDDGEFPKTLLVTGDVNEDDVSAPVNAKAHGWSLVGNPYMVNIDYTDLTFTDIYKTIYVYKNNAAGDVDAEDESGGSYYTWNGSAGGLGSGNIDALQGFYVLNEEFDETGEPKLEISSDAIPRKQVDPVSFDLFAEMDGLKDKAYFSFTSSGQLGTDSYDAYKLSPIDNYKYLSLGTVVNDDVLDINNLPTEFEGAAEFPLSINAFAPSEDGMIALGGEVALRAENFKNIPEKWTITLNNYNTGEEINLREVENYTFEIQGSKEKAIKQATTPSILTSVSPLKEALQQESGISISITANDTPTSNEVEDNPTVFALEQNYPNPFNPTTTIKYSVADAGNVNLTVYNVMGQKVAELVNATKTAGTYTVQWDAAQAASGMYFYKLSSSGQTLTKQMMLIK